MNEDDFKQAYAQIENSIKASDDLKRRTKASLSLAKKPKRREFFPLQRREMPTFRNRVSLNRADNGAIILSPAWKMIFVACLIVVASAGFLVSTGSFDRISAIVSGNSFSLTAYAEEPSANASASTGIKLGDFYPTRTSAGYLYDVECDAVDHSTVVARRYYAFNMTATGSNMESITYSIEGEGVSYGSWKSDPGNEGNVAEETSTSFTVAYDDGKPVIREIGLNYILDEEEKMVFDRLYESDEPDEIEALLATCDAKRLETTTIAATAVFSNGAVQEKSYTFKPVDGFENTYRAYLSRLSETEDGRDWSSLADEPALFKLIEKRP